LRKKILFNDKNKISKNSRKYVQKNKKKKNTILILIYYLIIFKYMSNENISEQKNTTISIEQA